MVGSGEPTSYDRIASIYAYNGTTPVTSWTDPESVILQSKSSWLHYKINAVDRELHVSAYSNKVKIPGQLQKRNACNANASTDEYSLIQCYPNPFNPTTKISYSVQKEVLVTIKVYDVLGNEVAVLVNETKPEGYYEVEFNADNLPSGVYIYKMQSGNFTAIKKMLLVR